MGRWGDGEMGRWGEGGDKGDKGDKKRSLSGGFRPSELRRERLLPCLPCLPCLLPMPNAQCPMPHAQ
ncbi:hypothetical protein VF14_05830 [Nostoc linckia z18]|uniref:Uncharacterized protein n=2 Tax=Nostoc linckia TaxID=92942 RepID=A0A9Q5ZE09_NOSLI|nr:hypothetical protein [Nostoc linckia]PHJ65974.1 hypothetical protein VF02_09035 [Nostoc linckia z1]PHJ68880.1 hypothetical protein VF05_14670 [Nostoc linckia z3]PHJ74531.1 hypothetical protein VF03_13495 [Nostoc linckia z2]PHJ87032.1 hypothetical protein VF06_01655 [Nostoc linckia z4]PHJ94123.1 hypothetical protein VF04_23525 [Nostoc linckia z7]PHK22748.1 hypothetical protein VF11_04035 [Nostoc linckia z14]PHK36551.1 hypothetical protein VF14_05830 [Nostoc linckia z18]PHK38449.1 hypothet